MKGRCVLVLHSSAGRCGAASKGDRGGLGWKRRWKREGEACLTASDGGNKGMEKREDDMGEGWVRRRWRHHRGPMCLSRFYKSIKRGISD